MTRSLRASSVALAATSGAAPATASVTFVAPGTGAGPRPDAERAQPTNLLVAGSVGDVEIHAVAETHPALGRDEPTGTDTFAFRDAPGRSLVDTGDTGPGPTVEAPYRCGHPSPDEAGLLAPQAVIASHHAGPVVFAVDLQKS